MIGRGSTRRWSDVTMLSRNRWAEWVVELFLSFFVVAPKCICKSRLVVVCFGVAVKI
jgi:energy-converting hydrogenase Eha subunit G